MDERDLGTWILPQPIEKNVWISIPKHPGGRTLPFGYKQSETDPDLLDPIPLELDALEKARVYLKQYSLEQVAAWLTKTTGRVITKDGLSKRFRREVTRKRKVAYYRNLARRLHKTLNQAKEYEVKLGKEGNTAFFDSDFYVSLSERASRELSSSNDGE